MSRRAEGLISWGAFVMHLFSLLKARGEVLNYGLLFLAILVYLGLTYFVPQPAPTNTLGLSKTQLDLIQLGVTIPYLLTWAVAVYGLTILGGYIKASAPKTAELLPILKGLYVGLAWIVSGTIVSALLGAIHTTSPSLQTGLTVTKNYLYIAPLLVGFWLIYKGIRLTLASQKLPATKTGSDSFMKLVIVLALAASYSFLVFTNSSRQVALSADMPATYYMPDFMIVLTIIIPVVVTWWLGFSVAFKLSDFIPHVARAESFRAMTRILYGIWGVIFTSILLQIVLSLGSTRLLEIGLGSLLGVVFLFLLLQAVGYLFLTFGIRGLQKAGTTS